MQYFLEIVPTVYQRGSKQVHTNQFSATWHYSPVDLNEQHVELPGMEGAMVPSAPLFLGFSLVNFGRACRDRDTDLSLSLLTSLSLRRRLFQV